MTSPKAVFELGLNHMGDKARAHRMIDLLASQRATHATIQVVTDPATMMRDRQAVEKLARNCMSLDDNLAVIRYARERGLKIGATVTDPAHVRPLADAGVSFFKILSSDLGYPSLHESVARAGSPFYLSTGAASIDDILRAISAVRVRNPGADLRLIHTVLAIPAPANRLDLLNLVDLKARFRVPVAYGQHSDIEDALGIAVALGAESVFVYVAEEKVPDLPDGPHSVLCARAGEILGKIALTGTMLGHPERILSADDEKTRGAIRRSIVAARSIRKGETFSPEMLAFKRPATGIPPEALSSVVGRTADKDFSLDEDIKLGN